MMRLSRSLVKAIISALEAHLLARAEPRPCAVDNVEKRVLK